MLVRGLVVLALATAAGAGVLDEMDRAELVEIEHMVKLGRTLEARERLRGRDKQVVAGKPGERYRIAAGTLKAARAVGDQALANACLGVLREDGIALAGQSLQADDAERPALYRCAVKVLSLLPELDGDAYYSRGWCQYQLSELAAARADLAAAVALSPGNRTARATLARTQWRLGERRAAIVTVVDGLKRDPSRADAELLADMLRFAKRHGKEVRAQAIAEKWARTIPKDDSASPLHALLGEMQLERDDLSGALDTFGRVVANDRPWLLGGIVRNARSQAARGATERATVQSALARLPLEAGAMPAPIQRLSGDLAMQEDRGRALRHYAAAVTLGEPEARELVDHARNQAQGAPLAPGAMAALLAGHEATYDAKATSDLFLSLEPVDAMWESGNLTQDVSATSKALVRAWGASVAQRAKNALAIVRAKDRPPALAISFAAAQATPNGFRRNLVESYLKGNVDETKSQLDACALVSWQVIRTGVVGALRRLPAGSGTTNVEPVSQPSSAPPALESVGQALAALSDPRATEEIRLAKLMEVAEQRTPNNERLGDPVAIDLDGNGQIDLTRRDTRAGAARFDLDGLGARRTVQWLVPGRDGWLCEDKNGDGRIESGHELFGTAGGFTDGFEKLALRDRDGDGVVSGPELAGLSIWREREIPGVVNPGELVPVAEAGVTSIAVPKAGLRSAATVNGTQRLAAEIWPEMIQEGIALVPGTLPDLDLDGI